MKIIALTSDIKCVKYLCSRFFLVYALRNYAGITSTVCLNGFNFNREKPLVLYAFTNDKSVKERLTTHTSSGAISFNDVMMHFSGKNFVIVLLL